MKLRIGQTGLDFDTDYGIDRRSGWTVVYRGSCCYPTFTNLANALWLLLCAIISQ